MAAESTDDDNDVKVANSDVTDFAWMAGSDSGGRLDGSVVSVALLNTVASDESTVFEILISGDTLAAKMPPVGGNCTG